MEYEKLLRKNISGSKITLQFILIVIFLALSALSNIYAQGLRVSGVVTDASDNEAVIGATVSVVNQSGLGTVTDLDGHFSLSVPDLNVKLSISYIGYKPVTVNLNGRNHINIELLNDDNILEEIQVVAYGAQKKVTVTGAISSIGSAELLKTPIGSITNGLAGKLPGVSTIQYSGEPGADAAEIYLRGVTTTNNSTPLIQVDGVERDFSQIDPNEIESITVLKDASATAVFGVRGANGVILVTTKRGVEGKAKISATTSFGVTVPTRLLKFANSYQYATYYNEAQRNDGVQSGYKFNDVALEAFRTGSDPIVYPDMDWMDYLLKKNSFQSQHNVNISGGTKSLRYFVSAGYYSQGGLFKTFDTGYDFNFDYQRYNYRANIDFDASKTTTISLNLGGRVEDKNTPISQEDQNQLFRHMYWATPFGGAGIVNNRWIKTNPDIITDPGFDGLQPYYGKGYRNKLYNNLALDLMLAQKLDFVTPGLALRVKGSYNSDYSQTKTRASSKAYYYPMLNDDGTLGYRKNGEDGELGYGENYDSGRNFYFETGLDYNKVVGDHNLGGLVLYNQSKYYYPKEYTDIPSGYVGLVGRVTYNYKSKYMIEANVGYNGSENFAPGKRYGFFPAGSVGWIATEESWMQGVKKYVNYLKVRASYGKVGNDKAGDSRFMYIADSFKLDGGGYNFGTNVSAKKPGAYENSKSNPDVTWEKAYKQNYGLDMYLLNERLKVTADFFKEHRKDILISPGNLPGFLGMKLPVMNHGIVDSHGYELSLNWNTKIGNDFTYYISPNMSFSRNKVVERLEVRPNENYLWRTGHPVNQPFVRQFWGFYDETANERYKAQYGTDIADHSTALKPGDAVYLDINGDGVINNDDELATGYTNLPEYVFGLNMGFSWKGFDFSMLWTGATNTSRLLQETLREPLGDTNNKGLLLYQFQDRWTPETATTASLPRASITSKANNIANSTLYLKDASYMRLKSIEIGYNFNFPFMQKSKINSLRIYANGYNLLTFDKLKITDPESRTSDRPNYPLTKVFNLGLKIGF